MIIGIDHIAFSSSNPAVPIDFLRSLGYRITITGMQIDNLDIKQPFLQRADRLHDLILLEKQGSFSIEILNHGYVSQANDYIFPVFENTPSNISDFVSSTQLDGATLEKARLKTLEKEIFIQPCHETDEFRFNKVVITTAMMERSRFFWESFGLKSSISRADYCLLKFDSPLDQTSYIMHLVAKDRGDFQPSLDARSFNSIAFLSTSVLKEKQFLDERGLDVTEVQRLVVGENELEICFAAGPTGELVEIVGLHNQQHSR